MNHWLLKSEPDCYSWSDLLQDQSTFWDGVHNYQARNNLRAMKKGDLAFFYHSGDERQIMGIAKIVGEAYSDKKDPVWSWVDIELVKALPRPVTLKELKEHPGLAKMNLFRQSRLSVVAITPEEWEVILAIL